MTDLTTTLREEIRRIIERSPDDDGAYVRAADLLQQAPLQSLPPLRLAILRSFTIEPLVEALQVKCFLEGMRLELFLSEFNQVAQEILSADSKLYRFDPQVVFLAVRLEEIGPEAVETLSGWLERIGRQSTANVLVSNFIIPATGQASAVSSINAELLKLRDHFPRVSLFDLEGLASQIGKERFCDPVQLSRMSNPYRLSVYPAYAEFLMFHLRTLSGQRRKCLVLDLDNTLWAGTVGEDGLDGMQPFKDFQQALLELSQRGILLAINSKNNPGEALEMIRSHPGMVLKEQHFSAVRINWQDKADNLREIAQELNLGLDAMVFVDDSPAECERVRQACPEVLVVQLPAERDRYRSVIEGLSCFEQGTLTDEDRGRAGMYQAQAERKKLAFQCGSLEDFYASLKMKGSLCRNDRSQIPRIAQMTQRTNQFNLTTRRCTESEIEQLMERAFVYSLRIEDRFGDNGIVAAAIVIPSPDGTVWVIDNLLMSCRVVMRTIEHTLLAEIAQDAAECGAKHLTGRYIPSGRNSMVKSFYSQRGFVARPAGPADCAEYIFDLTGKERPKASPWIELTREVEIRR